jgi:hypothetical protein
VCAASAGVAIPLTPSAAAAPTIAIRLIMGSSWELPNNNHTRGVSYTQYYAGTFSPTKVALRVPSGFSLHASASDSIVVR